MNTLTEIDHIIEDTYAKLALKAIYNLDNDDDRTLAIKHAINELRIMSILLNEDMQNLQSHSIRK